MTYDLDDGVPFGMYKGQTIQEVIATGIRGKNWINWACSNATNFSVTDDVKTYMKTGKLPKKPVEPIVLDFWQKIIINGKLNDVPF